MASDANTSELCDFVFPSWVNKIVLLGLLAAGLGVGYLATVGFFATHPKVINVGHQPEQPIPFSHALHAGKLKLDCRYCHNTVEKAAHAAIPPSATCGNCHGGKDRVKEGASLAAVHLESKKLAPLRKSLETNTPVEWLRVHEVPGFVYFNHSAHVTRGVSCVECHGRVDKMEVVYQAEALSMKWCLDCHRNPDQAVRPFDQVTNLAWNPDEDELKQIYREEFAKSFKHLTEKVAELGGEGKHDAIKYVFQTEKDGDDHGKAGDGADDHAKEKDDGHGHKPEVAPVRDPVRLQTQFVKKMFSADRAKVEELIDTNKDGAIGWSEIDAYLNEKQKSPTRADLGKLIRATHKIEPNQSCSTCHR